MVILSDERREALTQRANRFASNLSEAEAYLLSRGISTEAAEMFGIGFVPYGEENGGRLSIPYTTPAGVVDIKYRCTDAAHDAQDHKGVDCSKYLKESGCGLHLFNARVLVDSGSLVCLLEGEVDAITVQAYCGIPSVGYPGVSTWKTQAATWRLCFEGVQEIVVVADGDPQGRQAAAQVRESLGSHARVMDMPDKFDANKFINQYGAAEFSRRLGS